MSSATQADQNAPFFGECIDAIDAGRYEVQWNRTWSAVTKNKSGTTGFATILQSSSAARPIGGVCRIHLCAHNPCLARWPDNKYSIARGPPMHLQPVQAVSSAVAESSAHPGEAMELVPIAPPPLPPPASDSEEVLSAPTAALATPPVPAAPDGAALQQLHQRAPLK